MKVVAEVLVVDGARRRVDLDVIRGGEDAVSSRSDAKCLCRRGRK